MVLVLSGSPEKVIMREKYFLCLWEKGVGGREKRVGGREEGVGGRRGGLPFAASLEGFPIETSTDPSSSYRSDSDQTMRKATCRGEVPLYCL